MKPPGTDPELLRQQEKALLIGLCLSVTMAIPSTMVALRSDSMLLMSDIVDWGRVIIVSFMGWRILHAVRTGRASGFDYGTGRLQTLGGVAGASLYVFLLLAMAGGAVVRLVRPQPIDESFSGIGAALQVLGFLADGALWWHSRRIAMRSYSPVMELQWRSSRSDALCSLAVAVSVAITLGLSGSHALAVYLDPVFSLAYITFAVLSFLPSLVDGVNELADKTLQEDLQLRIDRRLSEHFHDYSGFHGVRSRRSGGRIFIEVALSFPKELSIGEVERTVTSLSRGIEADIPGSEARVCLMPHG